jgi:hypothetical protein
LILVLLLWVALSVFARRSAVELKSVPLSSGSSVGSNWLGSDPLSVADGWHRRSDGAEQADEDRVERPYCGDPRRCALDGSGQALRRADDECVGAGLLRAN